MPNLYEFVSATHPLAVDINSDMSAINVGIISAGDAVATAEAVVASAVELVSENSSELTTIVSGASIISSGAEDLITSAAEVQGLTTSAISADSATSTPLSALTSSVNLISALVSSTYLSAQTQSATLSSMESATSAAANEASSAISAGQITSGGIITLGSSTSGLITSAGLLISSAPAIISAGSAFEALVSGGSIARLDSAGHIPLIEMPYTAGSGSGIAISGSQIIDLNALGGGPDAYVYFGGAATATSGEYSFGIRASKGIASVVHNSTGWYTINFAVPFADANWIGIYKASWGGDNTGATSGDLTIWDYTQGLISEHHGGEYASRTASSVILSTLYAAPGVGGRNSGAVVDLARISLMFWAAPTSTITTSGTVSTAS
ncbi:hypothetical protein ACELLULO517_15840 [Acidisoma cellulosilytica]|uniref:Uncharacterized protein n=1 Tax=Acidisoma cellulosilyticum TaxID=2802395 RepID=A0A963Z473_9PROT|nr:hypothetical protein [Acidisoma cellulosilyticum]MCB8881720.1 hypothetical protein [Acidisoma cellulosilyticum]